jgi:hypothetical protein
MVYLFYIYNIVFRGNLFWIRPRIICRWYNARKDHDIFCRDSRIFGPNRIITVLEEITQILIIIKINLLV